MDKGIVLTALPDLFTQIICEVLVCLGLPRGLQRNNLRLLHLESSIFVEMYIYGFLKLHVYCEEQFFIFYGSPES